MPLIGYEELFVHVTFFPAKALPKYQNNSFFEVICLDAPLLKY